MTDLKTILPALALLAALGVAAPAVADPSEDLRNAAIAQIDEAGDSAGLARACGIDPTPITAAVKELLHRVPLDSPSEVNALARYRATESHSTRDALAAPGASPCGDLHSIVQDAVRGLNAISGPEATAESETAARPAGK